MGKNGTCRQGVQDQSRQGMTLVEVLIASVVLVLVTAGFISAIVTGSRLNYSSAQHVAAFGLCKAQLEAMRSMDYTNITTAIFPSETLPLAHTGGQARRLLTCTRSTTIQDLANPARKQISIAVAWTFAGRSMQERLDTAIYMKR